jgi:hypothetical protein
MRNKLIAVLSIFIISLTACSVEDFDSVNMDNTYFDEVEVINVPPYNWDNGSGPDLYVKLAKNSSSQWDHISNTIQNVENVPSYLSFLEPVEVTNEDWRIQLCDHDDLNSDDIIYDIQFNPYNASDGKSIPIILDDLLIMNIKYSK